MTSTVGGPAGWSRERRGSFITTCLPPTTADEGPAPSRVYSFNSATAVSPLSLRAHNDTTALYYTIMCRDNNNMTVCLPICDIYLNVIFQSLNPHPEDASARSTQVR